MSDRRTVGGFQEKKIERAEQVQNSRDEKPSELYNLYMSELITILDVNQKRASGISTGSFYKLLKELRSYHLEDERPKTQISSEYVSMLNSIVEETARGLCSAKRKYNLDSILLFVNLHIWREKWIYAIKHEPESLDQVKRYIEDGWDSFLERVEEDSKIASSYIA